MSNIIGFFVLLRQIMKKSIVIIAFTLLVLAFSSCTKIKYCQCFAYIGNEDVQLGEDYYMIESGTCNDKAKEIVGWGQVTCKEVDVEEDESWFESLYNQLFGGSN